MFDEQEETERSTFIKIDVEGRDSWKWSQFKAKLMEMVTSMLDTTINPNNDSTLRNEIHRVSENILNYANSKLEKASIENQKLTSEIELLLSQSHKVSAEARRINAEAESIELDNITKKLRIALGTAKVIAQIDNNEDVLLFCKSIEMLLSQFQDVKLEDSKLGR